MNLIVHGRPLLVAECRKTGRSVGPVKWSLRNWHFGFGPVVHVPLFSRKYYLWGSWVSVVCIATGYSLNDQRGQSSSAGRVKNVLFSMSSRLALGSTQPPVQWVTRALSPGAKQLGRETDHSPLSSAAVKKMWISTSTPPYSFMA
jgi:hypothetical protein